MAVISITLFRLLSRLRIAKASIRQKTIEELYDVAVIPNAYLYGRIKVTGPTIRAARDNAGAFVTAVESEIKGVTRDMKKAINRQLHSDGTDALAFWTGADDTSGTNEIGRAHV